jgi:hypothetical protein
MTDEFDRIASGEGEIVPSSGFVTSVMDAVRAEAAVPQPIPFPWTRALPVFAALGAVLAMLIAGLVQAIRMPSVFSQASSVPPVVERIATTIMQANTGWIALALLLTLFSTIFSFRVAGGKQ